MAFTSTYDLTVRSYELDSYNHVNNAVYIKWLEHGRCKLLQDHGLDYTSIIDRWGVRVMTVRTEIDYKHQLELGDRVRVSTSVERFGNTSSSIDHKIIRRGAPDELAAQAKVVIVFTDADANTPVPVPTPFRELYA